MSPTRPPTPQSGWLARTFHGSYLEVRVLELTHPRANTLEKTGAECGCACSYTCAQTKDQHVSNSPHATQYVLCLGLTMSKLSFREYSRGFLRYHVICVELWLRRPFNRHQRSDRSSSPTLFYQSASSICSWFAVQSTCQHRNSIIHPSLIQKVLRVPS